MSYREVHVIEVKEVVRLWFLGESRRSIARLTGLDRKTVHRYVKAAQESGGRPDEPVGEALVGEVMGRVRSQGPGVRGSSWSVCSAHRELLAGWLEESIPLSKVQELLSRHTGVKVPYRTLHRYATKELGLGGRRTTVRLAEDEKFGFIRDANGYVVATAADQVFPIERQSYVWQMKPDEAQPDKMRRNLAVFGVFAVVMVLGAVAIWASDPF